MVKSNLFERVRSLIAYNKLTSPLGIIYKRLDRKYRSLGKEIYDSLVNGNSLPEGSKFEAKLYWEDASLARSYTLALQEFKQVDPKGYSKFIEIKKKHTASRRNYLIFSKDKSSDIPEDIYLEIMRDVGLSNEEAIKNRESNIKVSSAS